MKFEIITIFPEIFKSYFKETLIYRASKKGIIDINVHDLRKWSGNKRKSVDDRPFGGGLGMVIKADPILKAVIDLKKPQEMSRELRTLKSKTVLFTPRGKKLDQRKAYEFSKLDQLIMICGRYEGVDERVSKYIADEEISIGDYILMGGELPAMITVESVARLIPGVVGKKDFFSEKARREKKKIKGMMECPQYTRPEILEPKNFVSESFLEKHGNIVLKKRKLKDVVNLKWRAPKDLISGNHAKIKEWREKKGKVIWR